MHVDIVNWLRDVNLNIFHYITVRISSQSSDRSIPT